MMSNMTPAEIVNLSGKGLNLEESRKAGRWMAKAFVNAPATPALNIFFGDAPHPQNAEMHETFWASHLNRVAHSGILLGARSPDGEWRGFRCFFPPGEGRKPYITDFRLNDTQGGNEDWDRFLTLAGEQTYTQRIRDWAACTSVTNREIGLDTSTCFTTSIIVTDPEYQRRGIGTLLDQATQEMVHDKGSALHVRIHEYILPFYLSRGYKVIASPTYSLQNGKPFKVHFLMIASRPDKELYTAT